MLDTPCPFFLLVALCLVVTSVKRYSEFHNSFATDAVTKIFACITLGSLSLFLITLQRL
jgi:L-asparagine transporter-like permease